MKLSISNKEDSVIHDVFKRRQTSYLYYTVCAALVVGFLVYDWKLLNFYLFSDRTMQNPSIQERGSIEWYECPKGINNDVFDCGRLVAPLDYTNLNDTRNASIAIIRYKAGGGNTSRSDVLGSILLNPGGPGGSGIGFLNGTAVSIDEITENRYDLVSFDPRGVGATRPAAHCFKDPYAALYYQTIAAGISLPGYQSHRIHKHEIGNLLSGLQLMGDICGSADDSEMFEFMGTTFVARDMQLLHRALGDDKLNYWGFSYGSVLGSTYADIFPEDINRLIIDGVVDVPNYYAGKWSDNFKDIEGELEGFFRECTESGPEACKLAALTSDPKKLSKIVFDFGNYLKTNPVPVPNPDLPQLVTYSMFINQIFAAMYRPNTWPQLAERLYKAIADGESDKLVIPVDLHPSADTDSEAFLAILCGDSHSPAAGANGSTTWEISDFEKHIKPILTDTQHFAMQFGQIAPMCHGSWQMRAVEKHYGNFTSDTHFPILALGNEFDPVTPGRYADKMARLFPNAVSVQREGYGHCSSSQPSKCIDKIVANYFVRGEIPEPGVKCNVDEKVFGNKTVNPRMVIADYIHRYNRKRI